MVPSIRRESIIETFIAGVFRSKVKAEKEREEAERRSQSVYPSWIAHSPVARHKVEGFVAGKFNQRSDFTHNTLKNIIKQAI